MQVQIFDFLPVDLFAESGGALVWCPPGHGSGVRESLVNIHPTCRAGQHPDFERFAFDVLFASHRGKLSGDNFWRTHIPESAERHGCAIRNVSNSFFRTEPWK